MTRKKRITKTTNLMNGKKEDIAEETKSNLPLEKWKQNSKHQYEVRNLNFERLKTLLESNGEQKLKEMSQI